MKRLLVLALAILAATQADGQSSATACWLGATWTTCFKPVVHTSMEGPASPTVSGYLSSADWKTFNAAVAPTRTINTTAPLAGGGPLSSDLTLSIPAATATVSGYLASSDWRIFNNASGAKATATSNGFLASADWATFNGKGGAYTQGNLTEATSAVLTLSGGTNSVFGSGTTIQVTKSDATHPGYLASADWASFNGKDQARTVGNLTEATSAVLSIGSGTGAVIGSGTTIQVIQSSLTANGYLSSGDWKTFNGGGATPANATTNGFLASADWATFNNKRVALAGSTLTGVIDGSAAAAGFNVNTSKSSPSTADAMNVYTTTATPTFTRTSSVFTCQTFFATRVGGIVYESGYCTLDSGVGTGDIIISGLAITPSTFSGTSAIARSQATGACYADTFSGSGYIAATVSGTTLTLSAVGATATGLRCLFAYRL